MSEPAALAKKFVDVKQWLEIQQPELEKVLVPQGMDAVRFARIAYTAVMRQPKLAECDRGSFIMAIMESAALGLEIDSVSGLSYLVPFKGRVQLIVGYRGMVQLAFRHPKVVSLAANAIYEGDDYEYAEGLNPTLRHRPRPGNPKTWETLIACYATARIVGGGKPFHFMWREDIEAHRVRSASYQHNPAASPWTTDFEPMAKKTPLRQLSKFIPQSPQLMRALAIEQDPESELPMGEPPVPHGANVDTILDAIETAGNGVEPTLDKIHAGQRGDGE